MEKVKWGFSYEDVWEEIPVVVPCNMDTLMEVKMIKTISFNSESPLYSPCEQNMLTMEIHCKTKIKVSEYLSLFTNETLHQ